MKIIILSKSRLLPSTERFLEEDPKLKVFEPGDYKADGVINRIGSSTPYFVIEELVRLENNGCISLNQSGQLKRVMDKWKFIEAIRQLNLPHPQSSLDYIPGSDVVIRKHRHSYGGMGVDLVDNETKSDEEHFFQEYIAEAAGRDNRLAFIGGEFVGAISRVNDNDFRSNLHKGGIAKVYTPTQEEISMGQEFYKHYPLDFFVMDMLISKKGPLILEVNTSPAFRGFDQIGLVNIPKLVIEFMKAKIKQKKGP